MTEPVLPPFGVPDDPAECRAMLEEVLACVANFTQTYAWVVPDDLVGRVRVLRAKAENADYWRSVSSAQAAALYREREYDHLRRRLWATQKRLTSVRKDAVAYKTGRDFDRFHELGEQVRALRAENERLSRVLNAAGLDTRATGGNA